MNYKRAALLAAVHGMAITFGGSLLMAAPGWNGDYLNVIGKGEATPHEKLAQPYANGKPRVFFLVGENRVQAAEVVELAQRIDMDYEGLTTDTWQEFGATDIYASQVQGSTAEEKERALVGKLSQPWDAIVIAGFQWDCLPPSCRSLIMDAVANKGTGLALIQFRDKAKELWNTHTPVPEAEQLILKGMPFEGLPNWRRVWMEHNGLKVGAKALKDEKGQIKLGEDKRILWETPFQADMARKDTVRCYTFGKGRIVSLDSFIPRQYYIGDNHKSIGLGGDDPQDDAEAWHGAEGLQDYQMTLPARAIYWAAKKEMRTTIQGLPVGTLRIKGGEISTVPLTFTYTKSSPQDGYALRWQVKDMLNREVKTGKVALTGQVAAYDLPLPGLPGGHYFLNVWLDSASGTEDWGHVYLASEPKAALGDFVFDKECYDATAAVTGKIKAPDGHQVRVSLIDLWDRKFSQKTFAAKDGTADFSVPLLNVRCMQPLVEAELLARDGTVLDTRRQAVYVPFLRLDEYMVDGWLGLSQTAVSTKSDDRLFWEQCGVNSAQGGIPQVNFMGGASRSHLLGGHYKHGGRGVMDIDDDSEPVDMAQIWAPVPGKLTALDFAREFAKNAAKLSYRSFLTADEVATNFGHYPTAGKGMPRFRKWLQGEYLDIAALNRCWGTEFNSFDDIPPANQWLAAQGKDVNAWNDAWEIKDEKNRYKSFDDIPANAPGHALAELKKAKYEWWFDLTRYSKTASVDFSRRLTDEIRAIAPHVVGGTQYLGLWENDAEYYARHLEFATPHSPFDESIAVIRDIGGPDTIVGGYTGGYISQRGSLRKTVWHNFMQGCNNLSLYAHWGAEGMIASDGSLTPYWQELAPDMRAIAHEGLGKWLKNARRLDSGVAILYDFRSVLANEKVRDFAESTGAARAMLTLCQDAGIQCRYVGGRQVEEGILEKEGYKVLLMPCAVSISAKQVPALRSFVEKGGVLIADAACGVLDGHAKEVPGGMLAELLGVKQNLQPDPGAKPTDWSVHRKEAGKPEMAAGSGMLDLPFGIANPAVEATTAKSFGIIGNTPVFFVNNFGKGKAVLLNFAPYAYEDLRETKDVQTDACLQAWRNLLGVPPLFQYLDGEGKQTGNLAAMNVFEIDGKRLLGLLPSRSFPAEKGMTITLDKKWHVYDWFQKKYLGETDRIPLGAVDKDVPRLFGLLPYKVESVTAAFAENPMKGKVVNLDIKVAAAGATPGKHLLWLRLVGPDGADRYWMEERPFAENGTCSVPFAFALNEKPGRYVLTATDVISQVACKLEFDIHE
jgi:hypothetical protein